MKRAVFWAVELVALLAQVAGAVGLPLPQASGLEASLRIPAHPTAIAAGVRGGNPSPPYSTWIGSADLPGYEAQVRIAGGGGPIEANPELACIPETICASGALSGRPEVFIKVIGPRPNGYMWVQAPRFTPSQIEIWMRKMDSGQTNYYVLPAAEAGNLPGLEDREAFLPAEELTFDAPPDCAEVPGLSPSCGTYYTAADEPVCACPVTPASADPEVPACDAIDPRTPLMGQVELSSAALPELIVGSYPDLAGIADAELASYRPEVWASVFGGYLVPLSAGLPAQECSGDDQDGYAPVIPLLSPDSRMILLAGRWNPCAGSDENRLSLIRCDGGTTDPGWSLREMMTGHSNWLADWGHETAGRRTLYYPRDGYTRLTISADAMTLYDQGGDPVEALVVGWPETVVKIGAADNAVTFAERDGEWRDLYAAFLTADFSVHPADDDRVCLFRWSVLVSDLTDCDEACLAGGGDGEQKFCCPTALIDSACYADGGEPTNPTVSLGGRLFAFHRDRLVLSTDLIVSTVYLVHNPFERGLNGCVTQGRDGLDQEFDCTPEVMQNEPWDDPGAFCPPIVTCGESGVDCSLCASIGTYEKGRNHLGFFEWPPGGETRPQYLQFERACTALEEGCEGNPGGGPGRLDIYEIGLEGDELQSLSSATIDFLTDETGSSAWNTGFHRAYHAATF